MRHADVHDTHLSADVSREPVAPGPAAQEIQHHLSGHGARIGADALVGHAVIGCEGEDRRAWKFRTLFPGDGRIQGRQFLQPPQASDRLGESIKASLGPLQTDLIHGTYLLNDLVERHHLIRAGSPPITKYTASASAATC